MFEVCSGQWCCYRVQDDPECSPLHVCVKELGLRQGLDLSLTGRAKSQVSLSSGMTISLGKKFFLRSSPYLSILGFMNGVEYNIMCENHCVCCCIMDRSVTHSL